MRRGMDFPDDITTNVFRVEDIKEIYWAFYTRRIENKSALQDPTSSQEHEDLVHHLQLTEYRLRQDGHHAFFDKGKVGVWVFSLSHGQPESNFRTLNLDGLEKPLFGSVRSEDLNTATGSNASAPPLSRTARSAHFTAKAVEEANALAQGSNASSILQLPMSELKWKEKEALNASQTFSVFEVYTNLISAISWSLSHHMGKRRGWIQVGPSACIDERTLGDASFDNLGLQSWITTTKKLCFDIKWLSSGLLLISFFEMRMPSHIRMSQMFSRGGQSTGLVVGSPILLSPSGIRCWYLGTEDIPKNDVQGRSSAKVKASILSRLALQGIRPSPEVNWIKVYKGLDSEVSDGQPVSLWPADLCFCEDMIGSVSDEDGEPLSPSIVDGSVDPLEKAESWLLGKSARLQASQARAQEEAQQNSTPKDVEDTDEEDNLSPFEILMGQGISPQDVSGIYPTPPDGLPPALIGSSDPNDFQFGDFEDEEKELPPSDEARGEYDEQENDDLFGDMDIDMFASNGLTEADFSFFDEPGMIDEGLRETGQAIASVATAEIADHPNALDGQDLIATPKGRGDSESVQNVVDDQEDIRVQDNEQNSTTTNNHLLNKDYDIGLESAVDIDDVDYGALEQLDLDHRAPSSVRNGVQRGAFEHVPFQVPAFRIDDKYNTQGRFAFDIDELPMPENGDPRSRSGRHLSNLSVFLEESSVEGSVNTGQSILEFFETKLSLTCGETDDEDGDIPDPEDSDTHDTMELSPDSEEELSQKRKREKLDDDELFVTPSSSILPAENLASSPPIKVDEPMSDSLKPNIVEQMNSMTGPELRILGRSRPSFTGQGQAFINVAQVVINQAVSGFIQHQTESANETIANGQVISDQSLRITTTNLLSAFFPTNKRCTLQEYASLGEKNQATASKEQVALHQRTLKLGQIAGGIPGTGQLIFKLESPYTRVRRNGISTEISASALPFWEELSLGPSHDTKDIDAFCLCPRSNFIEEAAMNFLNMIKGAYQNCNLGSHDLGATLADQNKRLVTVSIESRRSDEFLKDVATTCEGLGTRLQELGLQRGTTVIYVIDPFKDNQYLPGLCEALLQLPNSYGAALERRRPERQNNIVMQIVPIDLVWSPERLVVPSPADYRRLAFEIYSQCDASESGVTQEFNFMRAPAIRLAKAVPKTIDFKLVPENPAPLMQSDNCVHVSYTWDTSSEWLAAIWTDNLGVLSWRACYCLVKNDEKPWKPFYEVVKEILETSYVMLYPPNAPWQLFVCKDSPMPRPESDVWLRAVADSSRPSISCTLLTVDVTPNLTFTPSNLYKSAFDMAPGLLATPGATPQTNIPSPDISGLGSTPAGNTAQAGTPPPSATLADHDSEARLVDITDETWGVVIDGMLDDLKSRSETCVCMANGYLVKRAGSRDEDGLIPLGVNLVHGQKPFKAVLKEVLGMYRNLGTLARVRGVVDPVKSILPLHVAASRKAWKAVNETMRYEPK